MMNQTTATPNDHASRTMLPELNTLYQSIETRKAEMLAYLEALSDAERRSNPTRTEWSPLQVMEHVVTVEEWMSGPNEALPPANGKVLLKGHLFIAIGGRLMRSSLRMPTIPTAEPRGDLDFEAIKRRWNEARITLLPKLASVAPAIRALPIALHPVAGPLNARQVLELMDVHLLYHWRHFPRVKKSSASLTLGDKP